MARDRSQDQPLEAADEKPRCVGCGDVVPLNTFHEDTPVLLDRGARLCASCWIPALRRRMNNETLESKCTVPGCDLDVRDHIEHCKRIATSKSWQTRFMSQRALPAVKASSEANVDRMAEAERQIRELQEWTEREKQPWSPQS